MRIKKKLTTAHNMRILYEKIFKKSKLLAKQTMVHESFHKKIVAHYFFFQNGT